MKRTHFVLMALVLILCGCTSEETIDHINNLPSDDAINAKYKHVSKDAPDSLKPFYDADLTRKLNE